jgi:hypothetical protein
VGSSEQVPSNEWTPLEHLWEDIADAWFKPDGDASTFMFRVPADRWATDNASPPLTVEALLDAAAIATDEVQSWRFGDTAEAAESWTNSGVTHTLPPPAPGATYLTVYVHMKPQAPPAVLDESADGDVPPEKWQALEATWRAILGLEATIDALRLGMGGLGSEMETAFKRSMTVEEKVNALQSDIAQWNKGKSRVHYALPKLREFIHRATWASAAPERKRLEELIQQYIEPRIEFAELDVTREQLGHLQKDRQVLLAQGNAVNQECRGILAEIQRAFSTLQRNAAERARKQKDARRTKGKYL